MLDIHERLYGSNAPLIFGVQAYTFFVCLGIICGFTYYFADLKSRGQVSEGAIKIVVSGLFFGVIGSKIPLIFEGHGWAEIAFGKSIVGGILGGLLGVLGVKKVCGIKLKLGNIIAPSVALGMIIGRLGCFFNGCCYGKIALWGFDFGDGYMRLPTQLFEVAFHLIAFVVLIHYKNKVKTPGILFKLYILIYFIFRFGIELMRVNPIIMYGLTIYQIICFFGIIYITTVLLRGRKYG